jgi:hypothetical protein
MPVDLPYSRLWTFEAEAATMEPSQEGIDIKFIYVL